jgi:hypothetical protein
MQTLIEETFPELDEAARAIASERAARQGLAAG